MQEGAWSHTAAGQQVLGFGVKAQACRARQQKHRRHESRARWLTSSKRVAVVAFAKAISASKLRLLLSIYMTA